MRIFLVVGSGDTREVDAGPFSSVRELLSAAEIAVPSGALVQFESSGSQLTPDLSLAAQNVKDGDRIYVLFQRARFRPKFYLWQRLMRADQRNEGLARETYRVADASFLRYETFCKGEQFYERMLEIIESEDRDYPSSRRTHVEKATRLNEHPLPVCWKDT